MNHSTLEIFIQVAETQSVTQAAKRLGRAQSNITTRIQQLEEELAVELFVRGNKKMVLSPAGVQFLSYARRILSGGRGKAGSASDNPRRQSASGRDGGDRRQPAAAAAYPLPTAVPTGGYHPHHPTDPPVNRGVLTAALDAALVCLPPGPMGNLPVPPNWHSPRCFMKP